MEPFVARSALKPDQEYATKEPPNPNKKS